MGSDGAGFQVQVHRLPESLLVPYCQASKTAPHKNGNMFALMKSNKLKRVN